MPKYRITITAEIEVEAPNVAKADAMAKEHVRLIGDRWGGIKTAKESWSYRISTVCMAFGKPKRTEPNGVFRRAHQRLKK